LVLTGSSDIKQYIKKLKSRDPELSNNWGTICTPVEMIAADGKKRKIQAAKEGGTIAGNARKALEKKSGEKVSTKENYKILPEKKVKQIRKSGK
jgi:hypothetical protein